MAKKYYHIIIAFLIVLNVFSWRLWWEKPEMPERFTQEKRNKDAKNEKGMGFFIDKLQLNEEQQVDFERLRKEYFEEVTELNKKHDDLRMQLSHSFFADQTALSDSLLLVMAQYKVMVEKATLQHFKSMREVCDENQKEQFDTIVNHMMKKFNRWPQKRRGEGNKNK